jgi:hypothetical protein
LTTLCDCFFWGCDDCSDCTGTTCHIQLLVAEVSSLKEIAATGTWQKEDTKVTDPKSTGRKRAVLVKPLTPGASCEWAGLKFAGGGVSPIVGCIPGTESQTNVHHGPDKNTLNNSEPNLHRICTKCHNRWHALNDPTYPVDPMSLEDATDYTWVPQFEFKAHDPETVASVLDHAKAEDYWGTQAARRRNEQRPRD